MVTNTIALATPARPIVANDVDALVALARELALITTLGGLRDAIAGPLRPRLPSRDISVLRAAHGTWEAVVGPQDGPERIHQYSWTPLVAEDKTVGMLGIGAPVARGQAGTDLGRRSEPTQSILCDVTDPVRRRGRPIHLDV